jgi:hypothetical protein
MPICKQCQRDLPEDQYRHINRCWMKCQLTPMPLPPLVDKVCIECRSVNDKAKQAIRTKRHIQWRKDNNMPEVPLTRQHYRKKVK